MKRTIKEAALLAQSNPSAAYDKIASDSFDDLDRALGRVMRTLALEVIGPLKGLAQMADGGIFTRAGGELEQNFKIPGTVNTVLENARKVSDRLTDVFDLVRAMQQGH